MFIYIFELFANFSVLKEKNSKLLRSLCRLVYVSDTRIWCPSNKKYATFITAILFLKCKRTKWRPYEDVPLPSSLTITINEPFELGV